MRFLSVAERELRAAARRKGTYRVRWIAGLGFFGLLLWLAWAFDLFANRNNAPQVFQVFAMTIFFFCLMVGATGTADCISREKREGTLGLLFLTNLNSAEIVAGKLCANGLAALYALVAIFPVLALPLMIGGITIDEFIRVVLAEFNALFFAIAAGFVASAVSVRQFPAVAVATGLVVFFGFVLLGLAEILGRLGCPTYLTELLAAFCPLSTLRMAAFGRRTSGWHDYWLSLVSVAAMSWLWLGIVTLHLRHSWRDRPKSFRVAEKFKFTERFRARGGAARLALRRRLLAINPFFWLAGRQRVSAPVFMIIIVIVIAVTSLVVGPYFSRTIRAGTSGSVLGQLIAWLWAALAIHAFTLYYAAAVASRQLAEDKQTGALELILSTPTSEAVISRGLWLAFGRRMLFPTLIAVLAHCFFIWICMTMATLEPPGRMPPNMTAGEIFWCALFDLPLRGYVLDWHFGFMLHVGLLLLAAIAASWFMLGWVGRWLGLRMKHPGFAPLVGVALAIVPPAALFSLVCYLAEEWQVFRMSERQVLPIMMWIGFGICLLNCLALSVWAAGHLRDDFRATVIGRFSETKRRWWQVDWRRVRRLAIGTVALVLGVGLLALTFYGYQNWRSRRAWVAFQNDLKQRGQSLDLTPLLPKPVPDADNFACSPGFKTLHERMKTNNETRQLFTQLQSSAVANNLYTTTPDGMEWAQQRPASLAKYMNAINPKARLGNSTNRAKIAAVILKGLESQAKMLRAVSAAAWLPALEFTTNRSAPALLMANDEETSQLEKLQMLFVIRACASLATGRTNEAAEDLLTGLRLAALARQLPDARASVRVQFFLVRSLQPLWEGLAGHCWKEGQLAAFQRELAAFNLLADYTNAVHRLRLFYIDSWRSTGAAVDASVRRTSTRGGSVNAPALQPRAWWYYNCIQLYQAGERALENVDVANGRVRENVNWSDTSGLPLDTDTMYFLQQAAWWGAKPALVSFAQTSVNQAIVACALERHRLAHGKHPETMEKLVTIYLDRIPADIQRGRPLIYQYVAADQFILRGVGQNGKDDRQSKTSDDWLWTYSTNAPTRKK